MESVKLYDLCDHLESLEKDFRTKAGYKRNKRFNRRYKGIAKGLEIARWKIWDLFRTEEQEDLPEEVIKSIADEIAEEQEQPNVLPI